MRNNMWFVRVFVARETQDFASLQAAAIVMPIPKPSSCKSRDAKFCVSQAIYAFIPSTSSHAFHCHGLLVRRKILRLYWEEIHLLSAISSHVHVGWTGRDTQHFAHILGMRH